MRFRLLECDGWVQGREDIRQLDFDRNRVRMVGFWAGEHSSVTGIMDLTVRGKDLGLGR